MLGCRIGHCPKNAGTILIKRMARRFCFQCFLSLTWFVVVVSLGGVLDPAARARGPSAAAKASGCAGGSTFFFGGVFEGAARVLWQVSRAAVKEATANWERMLQHES